jgi:hypothetical protein
VKVKEVRGPRRYHLSMRRATLSFLVMGLVVLASPSSAAVHTGAGASRPGRAALPGPVACPGCYHPALNTSWQWQLSGKVDTSLAVQMFDIDGFEATKALVSAIHAKPAKVVCYISAGSWENWRPDASKFPASVKGASNGWPGERWLDIRRLSVLGPLMRARIGMCARKGFDAIEFDNVDGYTNNTGFPLTATQQLRYDIFLANQAHKVGLSAVLKNDLDQVKQLLRYFDFALNEQCFQYSECAKLKPFVAAGKAVFGVEYKLIRSQFCSKANALNFNFLRKRLALGVWRQECR